MVTFTTYSAYVDELLRVSDLHRATMKHAPKEQSTARREANDTIDWEPTRAAAAAPAKGSQGKKRAR